MSKNFWLSVEEYNKIKLFLPNKPRGVARVDDRRVLSGIIFCLQRGYRWSEAGVFTGIFDALSSQGMDTSTLMVDASHIKTHRIAANGVKKTVRTADAPSVRQKVG